MKHLDAIYPDMCQCSGLLVYLLMVPIACQENLDDNYEIIRDKILSTATPYISTAAHSRIHCAEVCSRDEWKCLGANVRDVSGLGPPYSCELFWVTLSNHSVLADSPGDVYLNPGRTNYWTASGTGLAGLSTACSMCICRESGCEAKIGLCIATPSTTVCGPYMMTRPLWCDATYSAVCDDTINTAYQTCAKDMTCSQTQIANYLARYEATCTGGATPTCRHYAIALSSGPYSCAAPTASGLAFWDAVNVCCTNHGGC